LIRVVSDTGPLNLAEADALPLLSWPGEVYIPSAVDQEMSQLSSRWLSQKPTWILTHELSDSNKLEAYGWVQAGLLGQGEAEAISLARQITAQWLISDDAAARLFAETLGVEVHGSLGLVLWAAAVGRLNRADTETILDRLAKSSLWVSPKIMAEAKAALDRLFS
jgi:predicted nucleic acid-binding protein